MKRFTLTAVLCLIAGVSQGTFELEDPARMVEDDERALANGTPDEVSKGAVKKVIVPPGTNLFLPAIENNECVGLSGDLSETTANGEAVSFTTKTYLGVISSTIDCPLADSDADSRLKVALIKTAQGQLIWVDSSKTLDVR